MSASSSASSFTSVPANVPSCDAWGNFNVGTAVNVALNDGSGISSVFRASSGVYGISFSNPQRFGGGAYVVMTTPEYSIDAGYGPITVPPPNGRTGAGISAGLRINTYTYPNGFHPGGGTAALNDPPTGAYRVNVAAFSFATDSDLRSPAVLNVLKNSELFTSQWNLSAVTTLLSTDGIKAPNGSTPSVLNEGTVDGRLFVNGGTQVQRVLYQLTGNYPVSVVNKPFTASVYLKAGTRHRGRFIVYDGASTHFGVWFDLQTKILSSNNTAAPNTAILSSSSITDVGGGWFRLVISGYFANSTSNPPNGNNTGVYLNIGDETGGSIPGLYYIGENKFFYVWGTQLEEGSVVTPYIKTESTGFVLGNQDARKRLVPGAQGFGVTGATYSSVSANLLSKRTATAYGTIVIPPNKGNSAPVIAYIENGFNVKGVSAGANSLFDISFVKPMNNTNYCTILSGEYESTDTTALPEEFSLLLVRAGAGNKYKTTRGFRAEALRQNTADNSWYQAAVRYQRGFTQRIHFMVFGGGTYGQP
jgi:hypothetical protein